MSSTPAKPTTMALQRRQPTVSMPMTTAISVMMIGVACRIAVMLASGSMATLVMKRKAMAASRLDRRRTSGDRIRRACTSCFAATMTATVRRAAKTPRTAMICPGGCVALASFRSASLIVNRVMAASIPRMPRRLAAGEGKTELRGPGGSPTASRIGNERDGAADSPLNRPLTIIAER